MKCNKCGTEFEVVREMVKLQSTGEWVKINRVKHTVCKELTELKKQIEELRNRIDEDNKDRVVGWLYQGQEARELGEDLFPEFPEGEPYA